MTFGERYRPWAVKGFVISTGALLVLLLYSFHPGIRGLMVAQFTPGLIWHLPAYVSVFSWIYMLLNLPATIVSEVAVRTILADATPGYRALGYFAIWWALTPVWWWLLGRVGYRGRKPPAD